MVKLEIAVPTHWTWRPGQHVFLRFPDLNLLDNHPFTIASIPQATHSAACNEKGCACTNTMMFLVRAHTGSTKQLISHLSIMPDPQLSTIIDGPYGTVSRQYENCAEDVVLVAGGNGITACLPWLQHLSHVTGGKNCVTKRVKLVWMVRKHEHVEWIAKELQKALAEAPAGVVNVDVYVTDEHAREMASATVLIGKESKGGVTASVDSLGKRGVEFHFEGRPNLLRLVPDLVGEERSAVIGCGPEGLKIDLSNAVAGLQSRVLKGQAMDISLQTEAFDW
jgi:predicted ferric reductase